MHVWDHRFALFDTRALIQKLCSYQTHFTLARFFAPFDSLTSVNIELLWRVTILIVEDLLRLNFRDPGQRLWPFTVFDLLHLSILLIYVMNCLLFLLQFIVWWHKTVHLGMLSLRLIANTFLKLRYLSSFLYILCSPEGDLRLALSKNTYFLSVNKRLLLLWTTGFGGARSLIVASDMGHNLGLSLTSFVFYQICQFLCLITWAVSIARV